MSYHIVNIDSPQCSISCRDGQLTCRSADGGERTIPIEDVASIIITSFSAQIHSHLLLEAARHGVALIICQDFKPTSLVLPANRSTGGLNHLLNYGYAVLLSTILQKLFGVGLDPTFGISHVLRERSTPLAYDLMEPFRPCVDWRVAQWVRQNPKCETLTVTPEFRRGVTTFTLERVGYLGLDLEVRGCIEGVIRGFRRAVLQNRATLYKPWTPKNSKWVG